MGTRPEIGIALSRMYPVEWVRSLRTSLDRLAHGGRPGR